MLKQETIIQILWRYKQKEKLSNRDRRKLRAWLMESEKNQELFDDLSNPEKWGQELTIFGETDPQIAWIKLRERIDQVKTPVRRIQFRWINFAAAVILLMIIGLGYWFISRNYKSNTETGQRNIAIQPVIEPGRNRATLTLSDGYVINLDTVSRGILAKQDGIFITKNDSETISYELPPYRNYFK